MAMNKADIINKDVYTFEPVLSGHPWGMAK